MSVVETIYIDTMFENPEALYQTCEHIGSKISNTHYEMVATPLYYPGNNVELGRFTNAQHLYEKLTRLMYSPMSIDIVSTSDKIVDTILNIDDLCVKTTDMNL